MTELLRRHGVDLDTAFPVARLESVPAATFREVVLAWVGTDDDAFRVFEPGGRPQRALLTYQPIAGE